LTFAIIIKKFKFKMLGRAATRIELSRDNDWEELVEARRAFEQKKIEQLRKQQR